MRPPPARACFGPLAAVLALAIAVSGCGTDEPKRAVDARTEVLRFYGVGAPAVALLGSHPTRNIRALDQAAADIPVWRRLRAAALEPLEAAGIGRSDLRRLVRPRDEIEGIETAALAVGVPEVGPLTRETTVLVLATDQVDLLDRLLRDAAAGGEVRPAGDLHGAHLYAGGESAYATRDGVLVSAPEVAGVRAALERRDGDSDEQLDEDVVNGLIDELALDGPVDVYANLGNVVDDDPVLRSLASQTPWVASLGQGALSAEASGQGLRVELVARTEREPVDPDELPAGETPRSFEITQASVAVVPPRPGSPDPVRDLLRGVTPLPVEATATADEIRAEAALDP